MFIVKKHKQILPLPESLNEIIHKTQNLLFIRDIALARLLDDTTFATLNNIIRNYQSDILEWFEMDKSYLKAIVSMLCPNGQSTTLTIEEQSAQVNDGLLFFLELTQTSKMQHASIKNLLFQNLAINGIFSTFTITLSNAPFSTSAVKSSAILLLMSIMENEPYFQYFDRHTYFQSIRSLFRAYCIAEQKEAGLASTLGMMCTLFNTSTNDSVVSLISDCWLQLLDFNPSQPGLNDHHLEESNFLSLFYETYNNDLFHSLIFQQSDQPKTLYLLDLLCTLIKQHSFRSKKFIIDTPILHSVICLLNSKPFVALSAIRVIRSIMSVKDPFYQRHLAKENTWKPIVQLLSKSRGLLTSALLELLEFGRKENIKSLMEACNDNKELVLKCCDLIGKGCILRYEQNCDIMETTRSESTRPDKYVESKNEDAYFDDDDDDDDYDSCDAAVKINSSEIITGTEDNEDMMSIGLVSYKFSDDEDEDQDDDTFKGKKGVLKRGIKIVEIQKSNSGNDEIGVVECSETDSTILKRLRST